jgi:hypothetical protein
MHSRFKSWVANKLIWGWHPSGFFTGEMSWQNWHSMDEFQQVCWHWTYKNGLLERLFEGEERYIQVRFEDLFVAHDSALLEGVLGFVGIPYRERFNLMLRKSENVSRKAYCPAWDAWSEVRKRQLLSICGEKMEEYGYS